VKSRLCYVPDAVAFYPWMTVFQTLQFSCVVSPALEPGHGEGFIEAFSTRPSQKASHLSKGQKTPTGVDPRCSPNPNCSCWHEPTVGTGPDRAAGIHRNRHRGLPLH